jgi:hypothetical protein
MRRAAWLLGLAAAVVGLPGCSESKPAAPTGTTVAAASPTTTSEPERPGVSAFSLAPADVAAWNAPPEFPDGARAGVQALLDRYLTDAVLRPLRSGESAGDLSAVFAPSTLERVNGPDRAALVDEGLPRAERVTVEVASAALTALTGLSVVSAGIHILVSARVGGTPLRVERTGELQLSAEGDTWKVIGYDVRVTRDTPGAAPVTTTQAGQS